MTSSGLVAIVAEDEAPQRAALLSMLADAWPELQSVTACEDGVAALQAVAELRPAVAFLDIRMPGVSGLDVARAVVAAVKEDRFYVLTHPRIKGAIQARMEDILGERSPRNPMDL